MACFLQKCDMASNFRLIAAPNLRDGADEERELLQLLARGDTSQARILAARLIGDFPSRGVPWKVWGALLWAEGRPDEAVTAMQRSVQLLVSDAEAHCNLGLTLAKLERFADAEASLSRAVEIDPRFSIAHYRLGMTCWMQGDLHRAVSHLRRGLGLRADYAAGDDAQNHSNLLFILSHDPDVKAGTLFAEHRSFRNLLGDTSARPPCVLCECA